MEVVVVVVVMTAYSTTTDYRFRKNRQMERLHASRSFLFPLARTAPMPSRSADVVLCIAAAVVGCAPDRFLSVVRWLVGLPIRSSRDRFHR